jgi:hypothetical protein
MFLIDKVAAGNGETVVRERPVCTECHHAFVATPKEIAQFRCTNPPTVIVCEPCILRLCGPPLTLRQRRRAIAI